MVWFKRHIFQFNLTLILTACLFNYANGQEVVNVLLKVYDIELNPYPNIEIVLDRKISFTTDANGIALAEVPKVSLPPTRIDVSDQKLEAESWNYSKGTLEIILRKKNYKQLQIKITDKNENIIKGIKVHISTSTPNTLTTDALGSISFLLPNTEDINSPSLFQIDGYSILKTDLDDEGGTIIIEEITPPVSEIVNKDSQESTILERQKKSVNPDENDDMKVLQNVGMQDLDSITSLTVLYSLLKKVNYDELDSFPKKMMDDKFNELLQANVSLSSITLKSPLSSISDSSLINKDVELILEKIEFEREILIQKKDEFEMAANLISRKLEDGGENLSMVERDQLIQSVIALQEILKENEALFYKNNAFYKKQVELLQDQITDVFELEDLLFKSELLRRNFKEISIVTLIAFVGLAMITVFFKYIIRMLKDQKNKLSQANSEIEKINANLESIVLEKTISLKLINKELDTFLYNSSHNLKRPLTSIEGLAYIAKNAEDEESFDLLEMIVVTAKKMDKMLDKLTTMSCINQPFDFGDIDFDKIIETIRSKFASEIDAREIAFSISIHPSMRFKSYPLVIEVILSNLIENAIFYSKYSQNRIPRIKISIKLDKNKSLNLSVRDNGCGINQDIQHKIWDMFYIGNEMSKGDGLGLYITKKAVESLLGTMNLNTIKGKFCELNILLPCLQLSGEVLKKFEANKVEEFSEIN